MSATVVPPIPSPSSLSPSVSPSPTLSNERMVEGGKINGGDATHQALATAEQGIHLLLNIRCVECGDIYTYSIHKDGDWNVSVSVKFSSSAALHSVSFLYMYFSVCSHCHACCNVVAVLVARAVVWQWM